MSKRYVGKTALVTGAASGIGQSLVQHLTKEGATILCVDKNELQGKEVAKQLNNEHNTQVAFFCLADVTAWSDVNKMFQTAKELFGRQVDFVFANAGTGKLGFPNTLGEPELIAINVNLIGVIYTIQAAINHFREFKSGGSIIVTASLASIHPFVIDPIYTASKHGVLGLVRATAIKTKSEGIYINAIGPGSTSSALNTKTMEERFNARGWGVSKAKIIEAFDIFLTPGCTLTGQFVEAVGTTVSLYQFPYPSSKARSSRL